mmetsp:Transcript_24214/g.67145  ORF Transcript_24214/g.67145 Transcript_24214/m.67145 type:complete len:132 (-) Transcript_24214:1581-1976(-)
MVYDYKRGAGMILQQSVQAAAASKITSKHKKKRAKRVSRPKLTFAGREVPQNLAICIRLRQKHARRYGDCRDGGLQYIIDVLKYCREVLIFNNKVVRKFLTGGLSTHNSFACFIQWVTLQTTLSILTKRES